MSKNQEANVVVETYDAIVAKIKSFLKVDDDSKLKAQIHQTAKFYKSKIKDAKSAIEANTRDHENYLEECEEKLVELRVEEDEAFMNLDIDRVQTIESRKAYVNDLDRQFTKAINARKALENEMEEATKELESVNSKLESQIKEWEYILLHFGVKK